MHEEEARGERVRRVKREEDVLQVATLASSGGASEQIQQISISQVASGEWRVEQMVK